MKKVEIKFNKESFSAGSVNLGYLTLKMNEDHVGEIEVNSNVENITFKNNMDLQSFFEKIRGVDTNSLTVKFYEKRLFQWAEATFYEQQALKSLALIYAWLEAHLESAKTYDVEKIICDDLIVDWNYKPHFQNSIYLLPSSLKVIQYDKYLQKLLELNLLNKIEVTLDGYTASNYFIPLLTPGVPSDFYKSEFDKDGTGTGKIWKSILKQREARVQTWASGRF